MGIRGKFALLVPIVVALGLVTIAFLAAEQQRRDDYNDMKVRSVQVLQTIGVMSAVYIAQNDMAGLDTLVAHITDANHGGDLEELAVIDGQGRVVAHSLPERFNTVVDDPFTRSALAADEPVWIRDGDSLRVAVPARSGIRWATVTARYSLAGVDLQVVRVRAQWLAFALAMFLVMAAVLSVGIDRLAVRPIRTLVFAVRRMGEGHLNVRVPLLKGREMAETAEAVNKMADALQAERQNLERAVDERTRELQEANARLERLAVTDGLTGVYNHRRFQEGLTAEVLRSQRTSRPLSVLMVDVDLFKKVNDQLGHPAGDELLRRLATILQSSLRQTDLLARYGGEEFAVLLPETSRSEAAPVAERMRAMVEEQLNIDTTAWPQRITVSIGSATFPDDGATGDDVLVAADQALYVAKRQGRNRVVVARAAA